MQNNSIGLPGKSTSFPSVFSYCAQLFVVLCLTLLQTLFVWRSMHKHAPSIFAPSALSTELIIGPTVTTILRLISGTLACCHVDAVEIDLDLPVTDTVWGPEDSRCPNKPALERIDITFRSGARRSENHGILTATLTENIKRRVRAYFHYGCALRCVASDSQLTIARHATPRNATQRAAVMERGPNSPRLAPTVHADHG